MVLTSATIDPVCEVIAQKLGIHSYHSSKLSYVNDVCEGTLQINLAGNKSKSFDCNFIDVVVTDNLTDIDLIRIARKVVVVTKRSKLINWESLLYSFTETEIEYHVVD